MKRFEKQTFNSKDHRGIDTLVTVVRVLIFPIMFIIKIVKCAYEWTYDN